MTRNEQNVRIERIVIAITELSPVQRMWSEALHFIRESRADLHALFVEDKQWHRAASLGFTREISRLSGKGEHFTLQRAIEVHQDAINRARQQLQQLAAETEHVLAFEVLPESDRERLRKLVEGSRCLVIAPSQLANEPLIDELRQRGCQVVLISV